MVGISGKDERIVKTIANKVPEGKKRRGRPKRKLMEAVMQYLKDKTMINWRDKAKDMKGNPKTMGLKA